MPLLTHQWCQFWKNKLSKNRTFPFSEDSLICFLPYVLQLTIDDNLISFRTIDDTIPHLCEICKTFLHSPVLHEALQHICSALAMTFITSVFNVGQRSMAHGSWLRRNYKYDARSKECHLKFLIASPPSFLYSICPDDKLSQPISYVSRRSRSGYHSILSPFC